MTHPERPARPLQATPASGTPRRPTVAPDVAITPEAYDRFCAALEKHSGILLGPNKGYLVSSRLAPLIAKFSLANLLDLTEAMVKGNNPRLVAAVVDAMTTNETKWFRDEYPFAALAECVLPDWVEGKKFSARVLSAACSTGQESYSVSMVVSEYAKRFPSQKVPRVSVVATDISDSVLDQARAARYSDKEVMRGLTPERQRAYFEADSPGLLVLKREIAERVTFQKRNLLNELTALGKFDLVYCRNVLIYFSNERKQRVIGNLMKVMNPGAYFIVGGSESLGALGPQFKMTTFKGGVIYQLK